MPQWPHLPDSNRRYIQVSTGGGKFASGQGVGDMVLGAISLAQHVHLMAEKYDVLIALHTESLPS